MKNFEENKLNEFKKTEQTKTKYTKFVDENNVFVYDLKLPNGKHLKFVDCDLAMYLHSLEQRLGLKN